MNALMPRRTTRRALPAPMAMPIASAIASEAGNVSHGGSRVKPPPAPPVPKISATVIAASAMTDSIDRSMCPAIRVSDSPTAMIPTNDDCSRMFRKMPTWRKFGIVSENAASTATRISHTRLSRMNSTASRPREIARTGSEATFVVIGLTPPEGDASIFAAHPDAPSEAGLEGRTGVVHDSRLVAFAASPSS